MILTNHDFSSIIAIKYARLGVFMKRFFMYCIVIIGTLFVGLSFYMFAKNNEVIDLTIPQGETIYLNVGESLDIPITHTKKNKRTTIDVKSDNSNSASINAETNKIEAKAGGTATIIITPSNENFGPFTFTLRIGDGTNDNPYFISKAEQMLRIGAMDSLWTLDDSYEVVSNIDFKETWVDGKTESWKPIGDSSKHFTGNFNGGTKSISNLVIDESCTADYVGLFGYVESGAKVERVTLVNPQIKVAGKNVGAIAGYNEGSITRCRVVGGEISSSNVEENAYVGGIAGVSTRAQSENEIAMCHVDGTSLNSGNVVAGIVGKFTSGVISNCKVNANLANNKDIKPKYAAGLVGEIQAKTFTQDVDGENSFTYNSLIQTNLLMPAFGKDGEVYNATVNDVLIAKDTLTGDAKTEFVGNIFYSDAFESTKAKKLTRQEVEVQDNYKYVNQYSKTVSWDFGGTWSFDEKTETDAIGPYIIQDGVGQTIRPLRNGTEVNNSNVNDVIGQLMVAGTNDERSKMLGYTYVITEDVEIDVKESFANGWTPIGNVQRPFSGVIYGQDGAKITLKNVEIDSKNIIAYKAATSEVAEKTAGIFGCTSNSASISDIVVANMIIRSDETTYVGGIVGKNYGLLNNTKVVGLNIKNGSYIGGVVGYNGGNVSHCTVETNNEELYGAFEEKVEGGSTVVAVETQIVGNGASTKYVGGVVGYNASSIYCCKADVTVSGTSTDNGSYVGGIAGQNAAGANIDLCAKVGGNTIAGGNSLRLGGVVGLNLGTISRCYSELSELTAAKNYNSFVGGVVGENQQGTVLSSYFEGSIEGYFVGGIVGRTYGGTIEKSYSSASILASTKIGGLSYLCQGAIKNCYFEATSQVQFAEGDKSNNQYAGLTLQFPSGGYIQNCYVSTTSGISANGDIVVDLDNTYRSTLGALFTGKVNNRGTINNNIINRYGIDINWWDENVEKLVFAFNTWRYDSWKFKSTTISGEGLLDASIASYFTSDCKFDSTIWDFSGTKPKIEGLDFDGVIEDEFAETSISVALAEGNGENISIDDSVVKVTGFSESATITLNVTTEGTDEIPNAILIEGDCVEVGTISEGKLEITAKAVGTAKIQLTLTDGTILELTVEIA